MRHLLTESENAMLQRRATFQSRFGVVLVGMLVGTAFIAVSTLHASTFAILFAQLFVAWAGAFLVLSSEISVLRQSGGWDAEQVARIASKTVRVLWGFAVGSLAMLLWLGVGATSVGLATSLVLLALAYPFARTMRGPK